MKCPNRNLKKRALRFSGLKMELESSKNQVFIIRKFTKTLKISRIAMTLLWVSNYFPPPVYENCESFFFDNISIINGNIMFFPFLPYLG